MNLVRTNPTYISENREMIAKLCLLIDNDKVFPLAAIVIPELRLRQSHNTKGNTIVNKILRAPEIKRRRPPPTWKEAEAAAA